MPCLRTNKSHYSFASGLVCRRALIVEYALRRVRCDNDRLDRCACNGYVSLNFFYCARAGKRARLPTKSIERKCSCSTASALGNDSVLQICAVCRKIEGGKYQIMQFIKDNYRGCIWCGCTVQVENDMLTWMWTNECWNTHTNEKKTKSRRLKDTFGLVNLMSNRSCARDDVKILKKFQLRLLRFIGQLISVDVVTIYCYWKWKPRLDTWINSKRVSHICPDVIRWFSYMKPRTQSANTNSLYNTIFL